MKKLFKQIVVLSTLSCFAGFGALAVEVKSTACESASQKADTQAQKVKADQQPGNGQAPVAANANGQHS